jgi:hypothetical protein
MADDRPDFKSAEAGEGYDDMAAFMVDVVRLAELPVFQYERVRIEEAQRLNVRVTALDWYVKAARPKEEGEGRAGRKPTINSVEPWEAPVDGAELLDALVAQLKRFLVASESALIATALWIIHTHCFGAWWISPKLLIKSATKRCGKTRVFEILVRVVARGYLVSHATCSSVFRLIEDYHEAPPTLLIDEADQLTKDWVGLLPAKFWIIANDIPDNLDDSSGALFRRSVTLVTVRDTIPVENRNLDLVEKLTAELPGIVNWALDGLAELEGPDYKGFHQSELAQKKKLGIVENPFQDFADDELMVVPGGSEFRHAIVEAANIWFKRQNFRPPNS